MRYVVNTSGRKLGSFRDARMAHAIHAAYYAAYKAAEAAYYKAREEWGDKYKQVGYDMDKAPAPPKYIPPEHVVPAEWKLLGSGVYRCAYLSPRGVVYKVNKELSDKTLGSNSREMDSIRYVREYHSLPPNWAIPDATLYHVPGTDDVVIAMPLIDTSTRLNDCYGYDCSCAIAEGNKRIGGVCTEQYFSNVEGVLRDLHHNNAFPDANGVLWVVDVQAYLPHTEYS